MSDDSTQALDTGVLVALSDSVGGDEAFVVDLVRTYLEDGTAQLTAIDAALEGADAEALVRPAHTLKSASRTVGANRLGELSRQIEMLGRSGSADGARELVTDARREWAEVEASLRSWIAARGAS